MEKFIKYVIYLVENSTLEEKEKNKLLQFIEMVKKDVEDAQKSEKLNSRQKSCFYKAYHDCIKNACICSGIEDINEQILNYESKSNMLNETEKEVLSYLRNPLYRNIRIMQGKQSPVDDLSDEEIVSLYGKMDSIIESEGELRRGVGSLDELYMVSLLCAKDTLLKECNHRGLNISVN